MTPEGEALVLRADEGARCIEGCMAEVFSAKEREQLTEMLERVTAVLRGCPATWAVAGRQSGPPSQSPLRQWDEAPVRPSVRTLRCEFVSHPPRTRAIRYEGAVTRPELPPRITAGTASCRVSGA